MYAKTLYFTIIGLFISLLSFSQTTSDNFNFHSSNPDLITQDLIDEMENKFDNLDKTINETWSNINLLDRSQKIDVYLYNSGETYPSAPSDIRDWHVGYYLVSQKELHIKVPSTTRQLKYFPNLKKAAISIVSRYVVDAKKIGSELVNGRSFAFGLFESGYSPDVNLINTYLSNISNTFPTGYSFFSTWSQLDDETNVQLAYTYVFASIFRYGYIHGTIYGGVSYGYEDGSSVWYQITRIFFLIEPKDGGMRKFIDEDDFVIYSNSQEQADLSLEALRWYANKYDEYYGARINHSLLVAIYGSNETYRYAGEGNNNNPNGGGEARGHDCLRTSPATEKLITERDKIITKYSGIIGHEFMHNVFAFLAETNPPSWLNEGSAMFGEAEYLQGYKGINVNNMQGKHNFFWNDNGMYFPDLDKIFEMDGDFGYRMGTSAFTFIKNRYSKEILLQFMKKSDDFSIIGYSNIGEFQRHLYETIYHNYLPDFLFNPKWNLKTVFTPGVNFNFSWDGHYINDLILEYSIDGKETWIPITEVSLATASYDWIIPNVDNCILKFSDKKYPEIDFTYQILGDKFKIGNVLNMTFENGSENNVKTGKDGSGKDYVEYVPRSGNGNYAKFNGLWNAITVENYQNLNFEEDWTIQADFIIENTSGIVSMKPVLLEKISTGYWAKNYSVSFNNNGSNKLHFEYRLENNNIIYLDLDAGISHNTWYTFYFARSVENNIVEARVYDSNGTLVVSKSREVSGEGKVLTGSGDLYLGSGDFYHNERCLQGGLDNVIISDTYSSSLLSNTFTNGPFVSNIPNQTIGEGGSFDVIKLDDYVSDSDNYPNEIIWSYSGNTDLSIVINENREAIVTTPNLNWIGSETIVFKATDPDGFYGSNTVVLEVSPYELELSYPNGGEFVNSGETTNITWKKTPVVEVKIEYSTNNGTSWEKIIDKTPANSESYNWSVPIEISSKCLVRISDASNSSVFDVSDSVFEIGTSNTKGGPYVSDNNTVLLLHFDNNLEESSHNYTINDYGIAKTYISNPNLALSEAVYFNNNNSSNKSYITVPNSANEMTLTSSWTIEFWLYINSWDQNHNSWPVPILLPTDGWDSNYFLEIPANEGKLKYGFKSDNGGAMLYSSQNSISTKKWYHIALINDYANSTIELLIHDSDFEKLEEKSISYNASPTISVGVNDLFIGKGTAGDNYLDGYIDELRISNVVRSFENSMAIDDRNIDYMFSLFPNPTTSSFYVNIPEKVDFSISTISGQIVLEKKDFRGGEIETSTFKKGIYIVIMRNEKRIVNKRLIIK